MQQWQQGQSLERHFADIVDPEARPSARWLRRRPVGMMTGMAWVAACVGAVPALLAGGVASLALLPLAAGVAVAVAADVRQARSRVSGIDPRYRGRPIVGEGLDLLADISQRFAFAARKIDELPDLVDWDEIEPAVEAIRWDAAKQAAALSESEPRWRDVAHAPPGSPQAALRARLAASRADELAILRGYQRSADRLMNRAADAAAAATVASELGYDLGVAVRSPEALAAELTLETVIARLDALTEAWRALDSSTDLAAEALAAEAARRDEWAIARARKLVDRLDEATGLRDERRDAAD